MPPKRGSADRKTPLEPKPSLENMRKTRQDQPQRIVLELPPRPPIPQRSLRSLQEVDAEISVSFSKCLKEAERIMMDWLGGQTNYFISDVISVAKFLYSAGWR